MKHGGDISEASSAFGGSPDEWLDLSTGIAPHPYPLPELAAPVWQRLPQHEDLSLLLAAARTAYGVPARASIAAAPGTQLIIQMLPLCAPPTAAVRILGPTYSEHAISWRAHCADTRIVTTPADLVDGDVIVVTNPNNPDGRRFAREDLLALAGTTSGRTSMVIVDEAFADVAPEISVSPLCGAENLVILRSFGKFFGLAGVRLGFAIGHHDRIQPLEKLLGPWAVSGPACTIGTAALSDTAWISAARARYRTTARSLDALLIRHGIDVIGGTDLFRLVQSRAAAAIHTGLAARGILTRRFDDHPTWLRFGLPGTPDDFTRLDDALAAILEGPGPGPGPGPGTGPGRAPKAAPR